MFTIPDNVSVSDNLLFMMTYKFFVEFYVEGHRIL